MSETEPQKKGWFARFRSRGTPAVETPKPAEPEVEKTEPVEPAVAAEPETRAVPPQNELASEPVQTAPQPETAPVEAVAEKEPEVEKPEVEKKGWLSRLRDGLAKSTKRVTESITGLFTKKKLDQETLNELEDALIQADLGVTVAARLVEKLGKERFGKEVTDEEVRAAFADDIAEILQPVAVPLAIDAVRKPHVVLVIGVNGSGKTTTIAKLANLYRGEGRSVMLAAGDTFRAAAVEQLKVWGDRAGVPVVSKPTGADAAGLAYEALERARAEKTDVLLIDTAGRLHNKTNLMEELAKIVRVIRKLDPEAPHSCLLVLDATTGQNAHAQVETFKTMSPVDALVVTKLDGSAKGGVLVALAEKFKLPVVAIGVGEGIDDLRPFEARAFARGLMGLPA
ncbi:MAG: signal recognition particle-docking protein FtsY [Alphaproteobacteria bacterium 65-37]|jgi:fused signal recognition particle receptor|nr:signal recognition particle-docking protein FtsY [Alphaproteobacteria bacterium]OJU31922.1 MAG: signal recognition particle-docking protein FtsY [Alphaproteobacteria bacterium 65-37]